jgi:tetratricopeptide (TPR) repeat protein
MNDPRTASHYLKLLRAAEDGDLWLGLDVLCLAREGKLAEAEVQFDALLQLAKRKYIQPFQLALGYMALERNDEAIAQLKKALDEQDPFMIWLHLWPVFDPLRNDIAFRILLAENEYPKI